VFEDIGRFDISVYDSHSQQIFCCLNDLANDKNGLFFTQFTIICHIFQQISMRAIFCDEIAMCGRFVHILEFDDIGVV
jgi:hypothetical protein